MSIIFVHLIRIVNEVRTLHEFQQNDACARYHTDGGIVFTILTGIINIGCVPTLGHLLTSPKEEVQIKRGKEKF